METLELEAALAELESFMKRFALLDRDGTINVERHYLSHPDQIELLPNAAAGLAELKRLGLGIVVVTNQSGVGRGMFDEGRLAEIHERLCQLLRTSGVELDGIASCTHHPSEGCGCRKPLPGLVEAAAREHGFLPQESFVVGDKACDVELGLAVSATTLLVRTGYGGRYATDSSVQPNYVVDDLLHAARVIGELVG